MIKNKFFKNAFIYTLTEIINKAVPFLLLPILTVYLSPSDYGIVATYGAFTAILAVFINLTMGGAISVNFFKLTKAQLKTYIANVLLIVSITASISFIILLLFQNYLMDKLEVPLLWILISVPIVLAQFLTSINLLLWQVEQQAKPFSIYQITQMLTNTSMVLILVVGLNMGWEGQLIGQTLAIILFGLMSFVFIYRRNYLMFTIKKEYMSDALKFGVPLIPHVLSGWFRTGADRMLLTTFIGTSATGLYAVGYQFGMIVGIVALAINQAYSPYLYKKLVNITDDEKIKLVKYTYLYFIAILIFAGIISLIIPYVIINFLDEKYVTTIAFIPWIAFAAAFQGMYFMTVNYIFYTKKTYILSIITFTMGLLHVGLSYYFIINNGAIGAAQASLISFFLTFIVVWFYSNKVYNMPWTLKRGT